MAVEEAEFLVADMVKNFIRWSEMDGIELEESGIEAEMEEDPDDGSISWKLADDEVFVCSMEVE